MPNSISTNPGYNPLLPPTGRLVPSTGQFVPTARRQQPVDYTKPASVLRFLGAQSTDAIGLGQGLIGQGQEALGPVIQHLMKLLSGDPGAIQEAMLPEKQSVLSQYDTARRSISEFTPRGGGQVSTMANLRTAQAGELANLFSTARRSAVGELSQIGLGQEQIGSNVQGQGLYSLGNVMQGAISEAESKRKMWTDLGVGIGSIAAMFFAPYLLPTLLGGQGMRGLPGGQSGPF